MNSNIPIPAAQQNTVGGPSQFLSSLASALNPQSAAALDSVVPVDPPAQTPPPAPATPPPAPEPVLEKPAESQPVTELKKGFDALNDGLDAKTEPAPKAADADDFPPDATTPQAKNAWSSIKTELKTLKSEKEAWEAEKARLASEAAKAKQFTEADPEWKEYQKVKARLEEVEPVIARVAYTKTQAYRDTIETPRNEIGSAAKQLADQFKVPDNKMIAALTEPDPVRQNELLSEVTSEMDDRSKFRLYQMANDLEHLNRLDDRMAENAARAHKEAEAIEKQRMEQSAIEKKAAEMRAITDSKPKLLNAASLFTLNGETPEAAVEKILSEANETPFEEMDNNQKAFAIISASIVPRMQKMLVAQKAEVERLKKELADYSNATPRVGPGSQTQASEQRPVSVIDGIRAQIASLGNPYL